MSGSFMEIMLGLKTLWIAVGSSVLTLIFAKMLGKKREDIEVALKYQEYYQKHIDDLNKKLESVEEKLESLTMKFEQSIQQNANLVEQMQEKEKSYQDTLGMWQEDNDKLKNSLKKERDGRAKLDTENVILSKEIKSIKSKPNGRSNNYGNK